MNPNADAWKKAFGQSQEWDKQWSDIRDAIRSLERSLSDKKGVTAEFARRILNGMQNTLTQINWTDLRQVAEDNPS